MRIKRPSAVILAFASVAALVVGGFAYANHTSNVSSLPEFRFEPKNLPTNTFQSGALTVRTHTNYAHPNQAGQGGKAKTVTLLFDNDMRVSLAGIPSCTANFSSGTTIRQAWERCGPGADQAGEVNAYLSPPGAVSGRASTAPPSNFNGCTLVFKRGSNPGRILLFARVTLVANGTANCSNPATNSGGNTSTTLIGTLSSVSQADFRTRFRVPNIDQVPLPLDDFRARVKRGGVFKARCRDSNKRLNLRGTFVYSGSGQPADTVNKTFGCL
jgi:hypothetical protein